VRRYFCLNDVVKIVAQSEGEQRRKLYYPMRDSVIDRWRVCPNVFRLQPNCHKLQALGMSMDRGRMTATQSSSEAPSEWIVEILTLRTNVRKNTRCRWRPGFQ